MRALFFASTLGIIAKSCDPLAGGCSDPSRAQLPYCDTSLSAGERAGDLVGRLTFAEQVTQISNNAVAIERMGIPAYQWWNEGLHGVGTSPGVDFSSPTAYATSFPVPMSLGASFDRAAWREITGIISTEARAFHNAPPHSANGSTYVGHAGLTYYSPNINIVRDPRWGRAMETPGECPFLTAEYAREYVLGLQGEDSNRPKVLATCKHFALYDSEGGSNGIAVRQEFDAKLPHTADLYNTYYPAFQSCARAGVRSFMCSYNAVNGLPSCASPQLLNELRSWGWDGVVSSDCDAVANVYWSNHSLPGGHLYGPGPEAAAATALRAGTDLDCGLAYFNGNPSAFSTYLEEGSEEFVQLAAIRVFRERIALGMFDAAEGQPFCSQDHYGPQVIGASPHGRVALRAAGDGLVLLKNENQTLPLPMQGERQLSIAVVGPHAVSTTALLGNYEGIPESIPTIAASLQTALPGASVFAEPGCTSVTSCSSDEIAAAVAAVQGVDVVVLALGIDLDIEDEALDRTSLLLPTEQARMALAVLSEVRQPAVVVLVNGGPLDITDLKRSANVGAILEAWYGGQATGPAVAEALLGKRSPAGRLPVTVYEDQWAQSVDIGDMRMAPHHTYRYYEGSTVYPFGFGLSYSQFSLHLSLADDTALLVQGAPLLVTLKVQNVGPVTSDFVALLMLTPPPCSADAPKECARIHPRRKLVAFERLRDLNPSDEHSIVFSLSFSNVGDYDDNGSLKSMPGRYALQVDDSNAVTFTMSGSETMTAYV